MYLVIAPESPNWLIMTRNFKNGIKSLNLIAWINGSKTRIPSDIQFDIVGQVIKENQTYNKTRVGELQVYESKSIMNLTSLIEMEIDHNSTKSANTKSLRSNIRKLFCDRHIGPVFTKSLIMFTVSINIYYLSVFKTT